MTPSNAALRPESLAESFTRRTPSARLRTRTLAVGVAAGLLLAMVPLAAVAVPQVGDGAVPYTEQAPAAPIGQGVTVTSDGSSYGGGYVDFAIGSGGFTETLSLTVDSEPVVANGDVSIVGDLVYLGNGTTADIIGSVDPTRNGQYGQSLRVHFASPFVNPSFEADEEGWTLMEQWIDLGQTEIAGHQSQDTSNYDIDTDSDGPAPDNDDRQPTSGYQGAALEYIADVWDEDANDGEKSLHLESAMKTVAQCDIVHGPAAYSSEFEASAGDEIFFDWKASGSGDHTHVFGYIVDQDGNQTELLDTSTADGDTAWTEKATTIPANGTYRFVFVAGTFDFTCGTKAGASLLIDNVRVYGSKVNDGVVKKVVDKLHYQNTSDTPEAVRTVGITAVDNTGGTDTGNVTVNIQAVDDAPTLAPLAPITFTNNQSAESFNNVTGSLVATDADGDPIIYSIQGQEGDDETVGGVDYTRSIAGEYGTLRLHASTGAYVYVPDNAAIDGRVLPDTESFTIMATAAGVAAPQSLVVNVGVAATAPTAPTIVDAVPSPGQVALTWAAPSWIGGTEVTGYKVEKSVNGGTTWETVIGDTASTDTAYTVPSLTNGVEVQFRVAAINANGTGPSSAPAAATPYTVPGAPTALVPSPGNEQVGLTWVAPVDDGGSAITAYRIERLVDGDWEAVVENTGSAVTDYTVPNLTNGEECSFRVIAINAAGDGPASDPATVTPRTVPDAATALVASPGDTTVDLAWVAPEVDGGSVITGYQIEQLVDGVWAIVVPNTGSADLNYTVGSLTNGVEATFRVSPINAAGPGAPSNQDSATPRTVPDAATTLAASPGDTTAALSWVAPANTGGSAITGYKIEQSTDGGDTWTIVDDNTGSVDTNYTVENLTNGEEVTFRVSPINEAGPGASSNEASATPRTIPDAATDLEAQPGNTMVDLSWVAPVDNGGDAVTGYKIEQSTDDGETWTTVIADTVSTATSYTVPNLTNGEEVTFRVSPINAAGLGASSNEASATPRTVPDAATALVASPGDTTAALSWVAPVNNGGDAVTGYQIEQLVDGTWTIIVPNTGSADTNRTVENLTNGEEVTFRVAPINAAGTGAASNEAKATPRTVPDAATALVASPGDTTAALTWVAPVNNGGSAITGYKIEQSTDDGETWTTVIADTESSATAHTVENLTNGVEVTFRVSPINEAGPGASSNEASATPRTVPDAATDLVASPGDTTVDLEWVAPENNGGNAVTDYRIEQRVDGTWTIIVPSTGSADTNYTVENLTNGVEATFRVSPINEAGAGAPSNEDSATPRTVPAAPTALVALPGDTTAALSWVAPTDNGGDAITGYRIEQSTDDGETWEIVVDDTESTDTTRTIGDLTNGVKVTFRVSPINAAGPGAASNEASVTPRTVPDAATDLVASPGNTTAALSWDAPENDGGAAVTGYRIEQSTDGGETWTTVNVNTASSGTSYTVENLTNGDEMTFRVSPINEAGPGASSNEATATPRTVPDAATALAASPDDTTVDLEWVAPENDGGAPVTGYLIERLVDGAWVVVVANTGSADTDRTVENLTNGVEVTFRVSPINEAGPGAASNEATATPRTVPDAATDLAASPGNTTVDLAWVAPVDNGGAEITGYQIEQSTDGGETWEIVVDDTESTDSAYTIEGLTNGDEVTFRVSPINEAGAGAPSSEASATPRTVPGTATELEAQPGNTTVDLSWVAPEDDGGADVTGYLIEQTTESGETWEIVTENTGSADTDYTVENLTNGDEVTFRVSPINEAGAGAPSNEASATPLTVPDAPTIDGIESTNRTLTVAFTAPGFDGGSDITAYEYSTNDGEDWIETDVMSSPLVIGGLVNEEMYQVVLRAVNEAGPGAPSTPVEASPALIPVATPGESGVQLPDVRPGTSELVVDGEAQDVEITTHNGTWRVTGDGFVLELEGYDEDAALLSIDDQGRLVVSENGSVEVSGSGFKPGSIVDVWLLSGENLLGEATVGEDGSFSARFELPDGIELGPDTIQVNGVSDDGELRTLSTGIIVLPEAADPALASTGADPGVLLLLALVLLGLGAAGTVIGRRRGVSGRVAV